MCFFFCFFSTTNFATLTLKPSRFLTHVRLVTQTGEIQPPPGFYKLPCANPRSFVEFLSSFCSRSLAFFVVAQHRGFSRSGCSDTIRGTRWCALKNSRLTSMPATVVSLCLLLRLASRPPVVVNTDDRPPPTVRPHPSSATRCHAPDPTTMNPHQQMSIVLLGSHGDGVRGADG